MQAMTWESFSISCINTLGLFQTKLQWCHSPLLNCCAKSQILLVWCSWVFALGHIHPFPSVWPQIYSNRECHWMASHSNQRVSLQYDPKVWRFRQQFSESKTIRINLPIKLTWWPNYFRTTFPRPSPLGHHL